MTKRILLWKCTLHKFCCRTIDTHIKFKLHEKYSMTAGQKKTFKSNILPIGTNIFQSSPSSMWSKAAFLIKSPFCSNQLLASNSNTVQCVVQHDGSEQRAYKPQTHIEKGPVAPLEAWFSYFSLQKGDFLYFYSIAFLFNFNWSEMRIFSSELLLPFNDII